ncbi:hypothetical protein DRO53_01625, partial [Candidatus Bathyarchaeota archaeon]
MSFPVEAAREALEKLSVNPAPQTVSRLKSELARRYRLRGLPSNSQLREALEALNAPAEILNLL